MRDSVSQNYHIHYLTLTFLEAALEAQRLFHEITPTVSKQGKEILAKSKLPTFSYNQAGEPTLYGWEENSVAAALLKVIISDIPVYCNRVISLMEAQDFMGPPQSRIL